MKEPLKIYTAIPHVHSASYYYRLNVPIRTAVELGLNVQAVVDGNDAHVSAEARVQNFCEADVVLMYQPVGPIPLTNIKGVQSFIPSKRDGKWKWPPSIVLETDDNLFNLSPLNPAYKNLGIRDMEGNALEPGHEIGVVQNGQKRVLWRDGDGGFDVRRNNQTLASYREMLTLADAVTCSTEAVKQAVLKEVTPRRVKVFPNLVRFDDYEQVDLKEDTKKIKILWQGGIAHYEDWYPLRDALGSITKRYPEVHWIIWGAQYPWVNSLMPAHRYTFKGWCAYQEYKLRLVTIGHDIAIAPLQNHIFNRCRSAIKWYEASVLRKPAATLAQNSGAYKEEIEDGEKIGRAHV